MLSQWKEEAMEIGFEALSKPGKKIPDALYDVYQTFRNRFITSDDPYLTIETARDLEAYVNHQWTNIIINNRRK